MGCLQIWLKQELKMCLYGYALGSYWNQDKDETHLGLPWASWTWSLKRHLNLQLIGTQQRGRERKEAESGMCSYETLTLCKALSWGSKHKNNGKDEVLDYVWLTTVLARATVTGWVSIGHHIQQALYWKFNIFFSFRPHNNPSVNTINMPILQTRYLKLRKFCNLPGRAGILNLTLRLKSFNL